jgi:hypothetical protein
MHSGRVRVTGSTLWGVAGGSGVERGRRVE